MGGTFKWVSESLGSNPALDVGHMIHPVWAPRCPPRLLFRWDAVCPRLVTGSEKTLLNQERSPGFTMSEEVRKRGARSQKMPTMC